MVLQKLFPALGFSKNTYTRLWNIDAEQDEVEHERELEQKPEAAGNNEPGSWRHTGVRQWIIFLARLILPSFVTNRFCGRPRAKNSAPRRPTAYFDGLRGVAALIVYIFHYTYFWFPNLGSGYGSNEGNRWFWQLPIIRVIHSGRASVSIFFVISGYVLSIKTLSIMKARGGKLDSEKALDSISGSVFRRPFRLYPSICVQTAIISVLARWPNLHLPTVDNNPHSVPPTLPTATDQFWGWLSVLGGQFNPFQFVPGRTVQYPNPFDGHLWTIPVEWNGSMMIFLYLTAFVHSKSWIRISVLLLLIAWAFKFGYADQAIFLAGPLLAEASLTWPPLHTHGTSDERVAIGEKAGWKPWHSSRMIYLLSHSTTIFWFLIGCHLCSWPEFLGPQTPGFRTLASQYTPVAYVGNELAMEVFWISCGAFLIMLGLIYSPPLRLHSDDEPLLQRPFTTGFATYLGEISYSMYLCHGSIIEIVGFRYLRPAWYAFYDVAREAQALLEDNPEDAAAAAMLDAANATYIRKFVLGTIVNTLVLFWVSDLFNRAVDARSVRFTKKVSEWARKRY